MINSRRLTSTIALIAHTLFAGSGLAEAVDVSFILTNDVDQMTVHEGRAGLDKVPVVVAEERARRAENALFIHAGDAFGPSLMSRFEFGFAIKAYLVDIAGATDIQDIESLADAEVARIQPVRKTPLVDFAQLELGSVDNIEAIAAGPMVNGEPTVCCLCPTTTLMGGRLRSFYWCRNKQK